MTKKEAIGRLDGGAGGDSGGGGASGGGTSGGCEGGIEGAGMQMPQAPGNRVAMWARAAKRSMPRLATSQPMRWPHVQLPLAATAGVS